MTETTTNLGDITREQAIAYAKSEAWKGLTARQKAEFQLQADRLIMPFDVFHEAIEETLGRPVFTSELSSQGLPQLMAELYEGKDPPTLQDLIDTMSEGTKILVITEPSKPIT